MKTKAKNNFKVMIEHRAEQVAAVVAMQKESEKITEQVFHLIIA